MDGRAPFYGPLFGLFQLGLIVAMIPGTPKMAQYALFSVVLWSAYRLITTTTTGEAPVDLAQGSAIATQLMTLADSVFITDPDSLKDIYHKQTGKITEAPLKEEDEVVLEICMVPAGTSRWGFAGLRLRRAIAAIVLECACYAANASNPFLTDKTLLLSEAPLKWRALGTLGFAAAGYARIKWMNCLLSAAVVGAGFSKPERWPNLFGPLTDAWSVRRVWGRVWHHLLRKPVKVLATFTTSKIFRMSSPPKATQGTTVQTLIWLCTAFFITGAVHIAGETMLIDRVGFGAFAFFAMQPLGIAVETLAAYLWQLYITPVGARKNYEEDHHQDIVKSGVCSTIAVPNIVAKMLSAMGEACWIFMGCLMVHLVTAFHGRSHDIDWHVHRLSSKP